MDKKIAVIEGKNREVVTEDQFCKDWKSYEDKNKQNGTAVELEDDGKSYILPFRGRNDDRPGIYYQGAAYLIRKPESNDTSFDKENTGVTDFSDAKNLNDYFSKNNQIREMEIASLTDSDEIYVPQYSGKESTEMKAMKDAIASKNFDLNKYAARFGDNFLNEKRLLKGDSITMNKLISISNNLDIEAELILRNTDPNVANPMSKEIRVILTKGNNDE